MRSRLAAVAAALVASWLPGSPASAASPHVVTIADPSSNTAPSSGFVATCDHMAQTRAASQACDGAAIPDFNKARAAEGVKPLVLPDDFDTLSGPEQVLAISDLERVDRGLAPIVGLSSNLDALAQQGANSDQDPAFPNPFGPGRAEANSSWVGTQSALLGAFMWMYDDGPGAGNAECRYAGDPGCWGHRHTILTDYSGPIVGGAAVASNSLTVEIVGGDTADPVDQSPTWAQISATRTYGVAPANVTLTVDARSKATARVTATSAGGSGTLSAGFESGAPIWSVAPAQCQLAAGATCVFTLTFAPSAAGRYPGVLTISDGTTVKTVALSGTGITPKVSLEANTASVRRGSLLTIRGLVTADPTGAALPGRRVVLQRRVGAGHWARVGSAVTGGAGRATYRLHPTQSARYRLEVIGAGGAVQAKSSVVRIAVTR